MPIPIVQQKTVMITGCSTGIGAAAARVLRGRGWRVFATARKPEDVEALAREGFEAIVMDVADPASVEAAAARALEFGGGAVGGLVNNAGFGQAGAVEDLSRDALRYQFEVNVIGMQDLTNRLIPAMRRQGFGRIVNISSVLGRVSHPYLGAYSATKYAMESMSDAMRIELRGSGIWVSLVEPGPITSAFRRTSAVKAEEALNLRAGVHAAYYERQISERRNADVSPARFTLPPEAVAAKIAHALESPRPRRRYKVTVPAYIGSFLRRFAPDGLTDWLMAQMVARKQ